MLIWMAATENLCLRPYFWKTDFRLYSSEILSIGVIQPMVTNPSLTSNTQVRTG